MILNEEDKSWVLTTLQEKQFISKVPGKIHKLLDTPWSFVGMVESQTGKIYIKKIPFGIGNEGKIFETLKSDYNASVPDVIAINAKTNCFLMKDSGQNLREILKQSFDVNLACRAITQFTSLQQEVERNIQPLLNIGVPDWRLEKLPKLFDIILQDEDDFSDNDLSKNELNQLNAIKPKISAACHQLSKFSIKDSLVQPDCNDNNMVVKDEHITFLDLGEIAISHPFFSIINFLYVLKKQHDLKDSNTVYQTITHAAFYHYRAYFKDEIELESAYQLALKLHPVYGLLASVRLIRACGKENLKTVGQWKIKDLLKRLIIKFN